jgi:hypothetical protein
MSREKRESTNRGERPHFFLVSCPYVFHHAGKPVTYLFAVNSRCPPEALEYESWGVVELIDNTSTEIVRGGPEVARKDLQSRVPEREWRMSVGNSDGLQFQESITEGGWDENALKDIIPRIPASVLIIQQRLEKTFAMACDMAHASYKLHRHKAPLCADCVQFGCKGPNDCDQRTANEKEEIKAGRRYYLV